jgi:hypothetical protein
VLRVLVKNLLQGELRSIVADWRLDDGEGGFRFSSCGPRDSAGERLTPGRCPGVMACPRIYLGAYGEISELCARRASARGGVMTSIC